MIRYLRLWWVFFKNCLSREMEYRGHMIAQICIDVVWYGVQLGLFDVIYSYTPNVGGLSHSEMLVFLATLFISDAINMILVSSNFWRIPGYVASGELDFYLIKPVSTFFFLFFRYPGIPTFANLFLGISLLIYALGQTGLPSLPALLIGYPFLIACGAVVCLAFQTMVAAIAFRIVGSDGIQMIFHHFYQFGMKPDQIYSRTMKRFLLYIFPMGLIASVPARLLYGQLDAGLFIWTIVCTVILMYLALRIFYASLRSYSGASS